MTIYDPGNGVQIYRINDSTKLNYSTVSSPDNYNFNGISNYTGGQGNSNNPSPPIISFPKNNSINNDIKTILTIEGFVSDNLIHAWTEWLIEDSHGNVVFNSGRDRVNLYTIVVPDGLLMGLNRYLLRVSVGSTTNKRSSSSTIHFKTMQAYGPDNPDPSVYPDFSLFKSNIPAHVYLGSTINVSFSGVSDWNQGLITYDLILPQEIIASKIAGINENETIQLTFTKDYSKRDNVLPIKVSVTNTVGNTDNVIVNTTLSLDENAFPDITNFYSTLPDVLVLDVDNTFFMDGVTDPNGGPIEFSINDYQGLVFSKTTGISTGEDIIATANSSFRRYNRPVEVIVSAKNSVGKIRSFSMITSVSKIGEITYDTEGYFDFIPPTGVDSYSIILGASENKVTEFGTYIRNDLVSTTSSFLPDLIEAQNRIRCVYTKNKTLVVCDGEPHTDTGETIVRVPKIRYLTNGELAWSDLPDLEFGIHSLITYNNIVYAPETYSKKIYSLDLTAVKKEWVLLPDLREIVDIGDCFLVDSTGKLYHNKIVNNNLLYTYKYNGTSWNNYKVLDTGNDLGSRIYGVTLNNSNRLRLLFNTITNTNNAYELDLDTPANNWYFLPGMDNLMPLGGIKAVSMLKDDTMLFLTSYNKLARYYTPTLPVEVFGTVEDLYSQSSIHNQILIDENDEVYLIGGLKVLDNTAIKEVRKIVIKRDILGYDRKIVTNEGFIISGDLPFDLGAYCQASKMAGYRRDVLITETTPIQVRIGLGGVVRVIWGRSNFPI